MLNSNNQKIKYEIEFLRAISVLLVVFFHFEIFKLSGGFIGVDVFFVISGYLITSIILREKKFNFKIFYLKRIRRLFPIILLVAFSSVLVGIFIFSPIHFERLTQSSTSSIFGVSNYFFFKEQGYFDHEKLFKPLLHTWSLSVELQFYLIWPIALVIAKKIFKNSLFLVIIFTFFISLILSSLYSFRTNSFFYFTGFRFYEFMIGALLVFYNKKIPKNLNNALFLFGVIIILASSMIFNEGFGFPDYYAIFPCIGASLVILTSNSNHNFSFLTKNRIFVGLGKISYTVYMIHWPFLIFYRYQKIDDISLSEKFIIIFVVLIISFVIYNFYEKPFRKTKNEFKKNLYLSLIFVLTFIFIFLSNIYVRSDKNYLKTLFFSQNKLINEVFEGRDIKNKIEKKIINRNKKFQYFNPESNNKKILVIGDSHAFDFYLGLIGVENYKENYQFDYIVFDYLYCFKNKTRKDKMIEYFNYKILKRRNSCEIVFTNFDYKILSVVNKIIISNRWNSNINYEKLIKFFKKYNKQLILVGNGQEFYDIPTLFFKKKEQINSSLYNLNKNLTLQNNKIKNHAIKNKVEFFDKSILNCDPECVAYSKNVILYSDKDHWAFSGLSFFSKKIYNANFEKLLK